MVNETARGDVASDRNGFAPPIEEEEVEREAHPEGMDAGAAWNEEADAGLLPLQPSEPEEPGSESNRHRDSTAEGRLVGKGVQPGGDSSIRHRLSKPPAIQALPRRSVEHRYAES